MSRQFFASQLITVPISGHFDEFCFFTWNGFRKILRHQVLHPVKFILTDKINRTVFFEIPTAEIENTFNRFGLNTSGRFIETGAEKYQIRHNKRQCDDIEFMSAF